jgi:hypothetical protein
MNAQDLNFFILLVFGAIVAWSVLSGFVPALVMLCCVAFLDRARARSHLSVASPAPLGGRGFDFWRRSFSVRASGVIGRLSRRRRERGAPRATGRRPREYFPFNDNIDHLGIET